LPEREAVSAVFPGGGTPEEAARRDIPEQEAEFPEFHCFHPLPAWGLYLRHTRNIRLHDVHLDKEAADARPMLFTDDTENLKLEGVEVDGEPLRWG